MFSNKKCSEEYVTEVGRILILIYYILLKVKVIKQACIAIDYDAIKFNGLSHV